MLRYPWLLDSLRNESGSNLLLDVRSPRRHPGGDVEEDFLRGGGVVGEGAVGAEVSLQASHVACMGLHVDLSVRVCV